MNQKVANAVIFCNQDHNSHLQMEIFKYTILERQEKVIVLVVVNVITLNL